MALHCSRIYLTAILHFVFFFHRKKLPCLGFSAMTIGNVREMKQYQDERSKGCILHSVFHEQTLKNCALSSNNRDHAICCACVTTNATELQTMTTSKHGLHRYRREMSMSLNDRLKTGKLVFKKNCLPVTGNSTAREAREFFTLAVSHSYNCSLCTKQ